MKFVLCLTLAAACAACGQARADDPFVGARAIMVADQIAGRGVRDARVLDVMRRIARHRFVPAEQRLHAYEDRALPIGLDQTISQPYVVAFMTEALSLRGTEKVLEIGTGSGYQAAVLACLAREVYTIEIVEPLGRVAARRLASYANVHTRIGDGYRGWPEAAPFDAVLVTAAPDHVPQPLVDQLRVGGRLVLPVGPDDAQQVVRITRTPGGVREERLLPVAFVPMTGEARRR